MSIQYTDGSFSENIPIDKAVKKFQDAIDQGNARALYVGTENELEQIKKRKLLEDQITELSTRIEKLENGPIKSEIIIIPTRDEILKTLRKE